MGLGARLGIEDQGAGFDTELCPLWFSIHAWTDYSTIIRSGVDRAILIHPLRISARLRSSTERGKCVLLVPFVCKYRPI